MGAAVSVGVSLKAYFGHRRARDWCTEVAGVAGAHPAVISGEVEFFVIPTYLQILPALDAFAGTPVVVGAQDVAAEEPGPHTGEVTAAELAEVGVALAEIGHAERRRRYGETDAVVAAKTAAALRHEVTPLVCVGEAARVDPAEAIGLVADQVRVALAEAPAGRVVLAYEPTWAIGAPEPAPVEHIAAVARGIRGLVADRPGSGVLYGGSAGPGLLARLDGAVDGLFLGRFAHDPDAVRSVLDEAAELARGRAGEASA